MEAGWEAVRDPERERVWREVVIPLAGELRDTLSEVTADVVRHQQAKSPELFAEPQAVQELLASVEAELRLVVDTIEHGSDPTTVQLPQSTVAVLRSGVYRRVALVALTRFYRLAHERVWLWMSRRIAVLATEPADRVAATELVTEWLFAYVDTAVAQAEQAYTEEHDLWLRGAAAVRAAAIEAILTGKEADPGRASTRLRYEVGRHHLAVMAWSEHAGDDDVAAPALAEAVGVIATAVAAEKTLVQPQGSSVVAAWLSRRSQFDQEALRALPTSVVQVADGVRISLGGPGRGLEGFCSAHHEAANARRVAVLLGSRADRLTAYGDVAVAALGIADPRQARAFVTRVLGDLAADDEATYRLAETLAVYLEENQSPMRAGQRLIVHANTVTYRVRQAEQILGRGIEQDTLALRVALALLPTLPGLGAS